jgi:hypothetical protein
MSPFAHTRRGTHWNARGTHWKARGTHWNRRGTHWDVSEGPSA